MLPSSGSVRRREKGIRERARSLEECRESVVQLVAYGGSVNSLQGSIASNLGTTRGVQSTLLGVFACLVILSEVWVAGLLWDHRGLYWRRWRSVGGFGGVDAGSTLALGDEGCGAFVGDDLEVVWATGVEEVDGRRGPVSEDDGPLFLSHGDVLGVVVPIIAEGVELALKFVGDGRDDGVVGVLEEVLGSSECEGFGPEDIVDLSHDKWSDKEGWGMFYEGVEGGSCAEVTCVVWRKLRVLSYGNYVCDLVEVTCVIVRE